MKKIVFFLLLATSVTAFGQSKTEKIKNLLQVTGSGQIGVNFANQFLEEYKKIYPEIPAKFWEDFQKEIKADALEALIIPVYDKHFTETEIDEITKFYASPIGKKAISEMPLIMKESQEAGQKWGMDLAEKIIKKLEKENYFKSPPPPAPSED